MAHSRRSFLRSGLALALVWMPRLARPKSLNLGKLQQSINAETGGSAIAESGQVTLEAPDIAEDGALVPVSVESALANVDAIWLFVEKNPEPLVARFQLESTLEPFVSLRIKMNETCEVLALVRAEGEYYSAKKMVKVMVGGCG